MIAESGNEPEHGILNGARAPVHQGAVGHHADIRQCPETRPRALLATRARLPPADRRDPAVASTGIIYLVRMAQLFPELLVKCFTDAQIDVGVAAVKLAVELRGDRCIHCGEDNDDAHDAQAHPFTPPNLREIFLDAAHDPAVLSDGEGRASE